MSLFAVYVYSFLLLYPAEGPLHESGLAQGFFMLKGSLSTPLYSTL